VRAKPPQAFWLHVWTNPNYAGEIRTIKPAI
jgi:hypothetical protein